jgi:hypothetical protein
MSVLKYLSAGKSLIGLKQNEIRYRMGEPGALPKFDSKRNPFRSRTVPNTAGASAITAVESEIPTQTQIQAPTVTLVSPPPAQPAPAAPTTGEAPAPIAEEISRVAGLWNRGSMSVARTCHRIIGGSTDMARSLVRRVKSLAWWRRKPAAELPQTINSPVQGELSLDSVKVVRNDLTDADFEVVPRSRKAMVGDGGSKEQGVAQASDSRVPAPKLEPVMPLANAEAALAETGRGE